MSTETKKEICEHVVSPSINDLISMINNLYEKVELCENQIRQDKELINSLNGKISELKNCNAELRDRLEVYIGDIALTLTNKEVIQREDDINHIKVLEKKNDIVQKKTIQTAHKHAKLPLLSQSVSKQSTRPDVISTTTTTTNEQQSTQSDVVSTFPSNSGTSEQEYRDCKLLRLVHIRQQESLQRESLDELLRLQLANQIYADGE